MLAFMGSQLNLNIVLEGVYHINSHTSNSNCDALSNGID